MPPQSDETIREMIKHENELISTRMGWLLTLQGILFATLAVIIKSNDDTYPVCLFIALGFSTSILTFWGVLDAVRAIGQLREWWDNNKPSGYSGLPIIGLHKTYCFFKHTPPCLILPVLFMIVWIVLFMSHVVDDSTSCQLTQFFN